jgi:hypothetical protein
MMPRVIQVIESKEIIEHLIDENELGKTYKQTSVNRYYALNGDLLAQATAADNDDAIIPGKSIMEMK